MPHPPRIIGYDGDDPAHILENFEADARGAEGHDWYPISQTWTDGVLFVEYEHDPDRALRVAARTARRSRQLPSMRQGARTLAGGSHDWVPSLIVVALIIVTVVGVSMIAFNPNKGLTDVIGDPNPLPTATALTAVSQAESPAPESEPTKRPRSRSSDAPSATSFQDGIWEVGEDIAPGTYRTLGGEGCTWTRLRRLPNLSRRDAIAERRLSGPAIVTIKRRDVGFESARCHSWTDDLGRITESRTEFGEGAFQVGVDIAAGTYRSRSRTACAWERLRGFTGDKGDIIADDEHAGRVTVTIRSSDEGFSSTGCGTWTRVRH